MFGFGKKHTVTNNILEVYDFWDDNEVYVLITFDPTYCDSSNRDSFKKEFTIRIVLGPDQVHKNFITPDELTVQNKKEEELLSLLVKKKVNCKQVSRISYGFERQYIFECNDPEKFMDSVSEWKAGMADYEIILDEDSPYTYYDDMLPDALDWQKIGNRKLIELLVKSGANPSANHVLEHQISGPREKLTTLKDALDQDRYKVIREGQNELEIASTAPLDLHQVTYHTDELISKAVEFDCEYDGWQTAPVN